MGDRMPPWERENQGTTSKAYWCTEDKARIIAMDLFQDYEREVVEPRHKETQSALRRIEKFQYIGYGIFVAVIFLVKLFWK